MSFTSRATWYVCACTLLGALGYLPGCHRPEPPTAEQYQHGLVYLFPGVEGAPESMNPPCRALRDGGYRGALKVYDWNRPVLLGTFSNLMDIRHNLEEASRIAREIVRYRRLHPDEPIDLVGYSGGGGLAVLVAEALPTDLRLRYVILCQAAISPGYDLTGVLTRVDRKLINFYSPIDVLLLGGGTTLFGTIDREHTVSAGRSGFNDPPNVANRALAAKLEQRKWSRKMVSSWHVGLHFGMLTYQWNHDYVAPILAERWAPPSDSRRAAPPPAGPTPAGSTPEEPAPDDLPPYEFAAPPETATGGSTRREPRAEPAPSPGPALRARRPSAPGRSEGQNGQGR